MVFEGKVLTEITDDEIRKLVQEHVAENQYLEYKLTVNHKDDNDRFESLCDIASLANAGGGYIIIGIRDDGHGRAQKFESVDNSEPIVKCIKSLCMDYIEERIEGIEFDTRNIDNNNLIIIRIPNSSNVPHMINFKNRTHFVTRFADGKREMTLAEIKNLFTNNIFARRLSFIENGVGSIMKMLQSNDFNQIVSLIENEEVSPLNESDGRILLQALNNKLMKKIANSPYFRISATPVTTHKNAIDVNSKEIRDIFQYPINQRQNGWNMLSFYSSARMFSDGLIRTDDNKKILTLFKNAYMEFCVPLDIDFCWLQSEEEFKKQPRIYPYPVIEYPYSFLSLYKNIISISKVTSEILISMSFYNLTGYILPPGKPHSSEFIYRASNPYRGKHLHIPELKVDSNFEPDSVCFELLKYLYNSFGFTKDSIPFFDENDSKFKFSN